MITADLGARLAGIVRAAVAAGELPAGAATVRAAGTWRPAPPRSGGGPGTYATSLPFILAGATGGDPAALAGMLADRLAGAGLVRAVVTGGGYLTVTVSDQVLAALAPRVAAAGPACAASDALHGTVLAAAPGGDLAAAPGWQHAWQLVAAQASARLAERAGATITFDAERGPSPADPAPRRAGAEPGGPLRPGDGPGGSSGVGLAARDWPEQAHRGPADAGSPADGGDWPGERVGRGSAGSGSAADGGDRPGEQTGGGSAESGSPANGGARPGETAGGQSPVAAAVEWLGADAVRYELARTEASRAGKTGGQLLVSARVPAAFSTVRGAHADAAGTLRWAAERGFGLGEPDAASADLLAGQAERELLAAISWLPERVAGAARRRRPAELTGYLEWLAGCWLDCQDACPALPFRGGLAPRSRAGVAARLWLAAAAGTAMSAGLGLLGVAAPERR